MLAGKKKKTKSKQWTELDYITQVAQIMRVIRDDDVAMCARLLVELYVYHSEADKLVVEGSDPFKNQLTHFAAFAHSLNSYKVLALLRPQAALPILRENARQGVPADNELFEIFSDMQNNDVKWKNYFRLAENVQHDFIRIVSNNKSDISDEQERETVESVSFMLNLHASADPGDLLSQFLNHAILDEPIKAFAAVYPTLNNEAKCRFLSIVANSAYPLAYLDFISQEALATLFADTSARKSQADMELLLQLGFNANGVAHDALRSDEDKPTVINDFLRSNWQVTQLVYQLINPISSCETNCKNDHEKMLQRFNEAFTESTIDFESLYLLATIEQDYLTLDKLCALKDVASITTSLESKGLPTLAKQIHGLMEGGDSRLLMDMPDYTLVEVIKYLSAQDIAALRLTCKGINTILAGEVTNHTVLGFYEDLIERVMMGFAQMEDLKREISDIRLAGSTSVYYWLGLIMALTIVVPIVCGVAPSLRKITWSLNPSKASKQEKLVAHALVLGPTAVAIVLSLLLGIPCCYYLPYRQKNKCLKQLRSLAEGSSLNDFNVLKNAFLRLKTYLHTIDGEDNLNATIRWQLIDEHIAQLNEFIKVIPQSDKGPRASASAIYAHNFTKSRAAFYFFKECIQHLGTDASELLQPLKQANHQALREFNAQTKSITIEKVDEEVAVDESTSKLSSQSG